MRNRGFTLVELAIVVGIIGLLFALILPSIHLARELARDLVCRENLRKIGILSIQYSNDNDDYTLPVELHVSNPAGSGAVILTYWSASLDLLISKSDRWPIRATVASKFWACIKSNPSNYDLLSTGHQVDGSSLTYVMNANIRNFKRVPVSLEYNESSYVGEISISPKRVSIKRPSEIVLVLEIDNKVQNITGITPESFQKVGFYGHNGGGNVLFVDGHVEKFHKGDGVWRNELINKHWLPVGAN